ncbi:MAG: SUMF1/EgtB/PvdO family nonheme iron enzyme [Treponema sp.]|nr:SUMF1/EgtB/PvdO family nonheme iron enzyme [Treponema sp.]
MKKCVLKIVTFTFIFILISCKNTSGDKEVLVKGTDFDFSKVMDVREDSVKIKDFYITKNMVTRAEYEQFLKDTSYGVYSSGDSDYSLDVAMPQPDCPAMFVSFYDVCAYCNYLSSKNGLEKVYDLRNLPDLKINAKANGYRLPTKDEWFYAFFGGKNAVKNKWWEILPFSDYIYNSFSSHTPVGTLKPTPLGLYDMMGNGLEWTGTEVFREGLEEDKKYAMVTGTGVPGNSIQDYDDITDFLTHSYEDEPVASMDENYFYIGFRVARNAK